MNCTTPTRWPRPSMRNARPNAAVDLPLPVPVWTMSRPFSIVFSATSASCTALRFAILARWRSASALSIASRHGVTLQRSFHRERQSGDDEDDAIGARGDALVENALQIAKPPAERMIRHDAGTDFVGDQHHRRRGRRQRAFQTARFRRRYRPPPASGSTATASGNRPAPAWSGTTSSAAARSRGASMVRHCGPRRARCAAMRSAISASPASAVAT